MPDDPTPEIYRIMDQAGLDATKLLATRLPMSSIVNRIRVQIARDVAAYIEDRERPARRIEVTEAPDSPM